MESLKYDAPRVRSADAIALFNNVYGIYKEAAQKLQVGISQLRMGDVVDLHARISSKHQNKKKKIGHPLQVRPAHSQSICYRCVTVCCHENAVTHLRAHQYEPQMLAMLCAFVVTCNDFVWIASP